MVNIDRAERQPGWFYRLSAFFKNKFGEPVYKIPLDAGFSCPNRDGSIGTGGCIYCYNPSFAPFSDRERLLSITEQLNKGKKSKKKARYMAYFQSYTNTYAPVSELKALYDIALADPDIIGLSIATRPDCISDEILNLLENYANRCHLWVEYGLQTAHNKTLQKINRGHSTDCFAKAVELTKNRGIYICAHIILGLPGETGKMNLETIDFLNRCAVDGVKFHHLQIIRHTELAMHHSRETVEVFNKATDYIPLLCDCLERLSPDMVIHRLASQATTEELLVAPHWTEGAGQIASLVEKELRRRGTWQGARYAE